MTNNAHCCCIVSAKSHIKYAVRFSDRKRLLLYLKLNVKRTGNLQIHIQFIQYGTYINICICVILNTVSLQYYRSAYNSYLREDFNVYTVL